MPFIDTRTPKRRLNNQKNKHSSPMLTRLARASCRPWETLPSQHRREKNCRHTIWRVTHIRWINRALQRSSIRDRLRSPLQHLKQRRNRRPPETPAVTPSTPEPTPTPLGRPAGNVSRYAATYNTDSRAREREQHQRPLHGRQRQRHGPAPSTGLSSRANTRTNGR
jgi:hypothetical protein